MRTASKIWYKSKTLWFNFVGGAVVLAEYLQTIDLGEVGLQVIGGVLVVGNFVLRKLTEQPVTMSGNPTDVS